VRGIAAQLWASLRAHLDARLVLLVRDERRGKLMTLIRAEYPAGEHERFAERVADDFIGKPVTDDNGAVIGTVVRAWVADDGRKIVYEAEVEGWRI
jgi:hypothetical protein